MCGISGIYAFNENGKKYISQLPLSSQAIQRRGPDAAGFFYHQHVGLAHQRLSIIDTSAAANQPMFDISTRYTIVFNGEIFNYKELKTERLPGYQTRTSSDTEILLQLYIQYGVVSLEWLKGFFALAIYDKQEDELLIARDRFGKKPLLFYQDADKFIFASEMKAIMAFDIPRDIDYTSVYQYFQLNYVPSPASIFKGVNKIPQGHYLIIKNGKTDLKQYYSIENKGDSTLSYADAQKEFIKLMDQSVQRRLIADVPLGAFLSGGIDSSVVVALASKHTTQLNTFSIGYKDEPFFDETRYANLVAKKCKTNHTVFSLTNNDFLQHLYEVLDYIDEPFADSSCLPTYILCKQTRSKVTVALSGDGGDEVFAGYNKHAAEYKMRRHSLVNSIVKNNDWLWKLLPKSRNGKLTNLIRQLHRFAEGSKLNEKDRYYRWCSISTPDNALKMFSPAIQQKIDQDIFAIRKEQVTTSIVNDKDFNQVLEADMNGVLVSNMLFKVDMMSMANSLEVRSPFLDADVVDFAFSLPAEYKIDNNLKKKIVQDAFRSELPEELYNRPKKGFEIPLLNWFRNELQSLIKDDLLNDKFIEEQGIFDVECIRTIKQQLFSADSGDSHAIIWQLIVFQYWWKKWINI
ncbi:asparagine synthase (glutamine-hydrolyzing) [Ferruginibacter lapsinanis]|uniref:asparagine synthase (glutamine-hydrolyzing) n=1 Tax=Ferruginibacter lapsinanis TaxID=563172 RepID=UPI001E6175D7|nr:asparagine synthase (glutamine-hydrolyzing) [Ferruginibacter lapsinanis]UEG50550.1 asparagine synthase (glutamine-hydrolyzing) [Ferruginibacter lapsinanis]